jgi:predicted  nucleic acid-binding Zn-ribbon protein
LRQLEAERNELRSQLVRVKDKLSHSTAEEAALQNDLEAAHKELETAKASRASLSVLPKRVNRPRHALANSRTISIRSLGG